MLRLTSSGAKFDQGCVHSCEGVPIARKGANAPEAEQLLTDLERQQLIALLETALNVLKSPLVETGMLKAVQKTLKETSKTAAKSSLQKGLGKLMDAGADRIAELLIKLIT